MGPFSYQSTDAPDVVLVRLRAEGRRWRLDDLLPEVREVGTGVAVRGTGSRFRVWVHPYGRAASLVAEGEVVGGTAGAPLEGRVGHARATVVGFGFWSAAALALAAFSLSAGATRAPYPAAP